MTPRHSRRRVLHPASAAIAAALAGCGLPVAVERRKRAVERKAVKAVARKAAAKKKGTTGPRHL